MNRFQQKKIDIKNPIYCFLDDISIQKIQIQISPNKTKIEKSYKNILIYHIGYVTVKNLSYVKINGVNPL